MIHEKFHGGAELDSIGTKSPILQAVLAGQRVASKLPDMNLSHASYDGGIAPGGVGQSSYQGRQ